MGLCRWGGGCIGCLLMLVPFCIRPFALPGLRPSSLPTSVEAKHVADQSSFKTLTEFVPSTTQETGDRGFQKTVESTVVMQPPVVHDSSEQNEDTREVYSGLWNITAFLDGCTQIYLDMGSNIGVQVRKLFEPHLFPKARKLLAMYEKAFGTPEHRALPFQQSGLCSLGFEANRRHQKRLQDLEASYLGQGWKVHFFVPLAVADKNKNLTFWTNGQGSSKQWGASLIRDRGIMPQYGQRKTVVEAVDITAWILQHLKRRHFTERANVRPYVLAKMDIEGAEYFVLPQMMEKGVLCTGTIDEMYIEWHRVAKETKLSVQSKVNDKRRCLPQAITKMSDIDDETYLGDWHPLPGKPGKKP